MSGFTIQGKDLIYRILKLPGVLMANHYNYAGNIRKKEIIWFIIYRSVNGIDMMTYKNLKADQHSFTDNNLTKGTYQYSIKVVYKDGGESQILKSLPVSFVPAIK